MGRLAFPSLLLISVIISGISGQECNADLASECYYNGAGTISAGTSTASNKYFVIGGLFDIHTKTTDEFCSTDLSVNGMTQLMAFFWSVDKFGRDKFTPAQMIPGALAFDSCMRPDQTIENVLSFSSCKVRVQGINQQNVIAYVGPYSNADAARTTMLAADLKLTLVSPAADASTFDDKTNDAYKYLLRMKPSVNANINAVVAFLKQQNAHFVMVVYSAETKDQYETLVTSFKDSSINVCQDFSFHLESESQIEELAKTIKNYETGNFIVPLLSKDMIKKLIVATEKEGATDLVYILNSVGRDRAVVKNNAVIVEQTPSLSYVNDVSEFNNFLMRVNQNATLNGNFGNIGVVNPWLSSWITQGKAFPDLTNLESSPLYMDILRTINSVELIMDGFNRAVTDICGNSANYQICDQLRNKRDIMYENINNNMFQEDGQLSEDKISYNYYLYETANLQQELFRKVGSYKANTGVTLDSPVTFQSECPLNLACCTPPTTEMPSTQPATKASTGDGTTGAPTTVYVSYPIGKEITGAFSKMERSSEEYGTRFDINQKWIIALGVLAGLGIVCVFVFEIYILFKMIGKKVDNKWRTMWLGQLLLFGIFLSYLTCIAYLFIPTEATCGITRFGVGVSYAICFAVLLVKLMVILTSKTSEVLMPGDMDSPNYLKGVYQFLMFVFAVGVQVVINVQWLITVPPEAIKVVSHSGSHVWVCNHYTWETGNDMMNMANFIRTNFDNHVLSLTYIMVLILIITILSLNAHGIITNHRESVFIGIAAGFSIPIWLAWGLVGGLNQENDYGHEFGDACIAFGLFLTATLILFSMFLPKVRQLVNMGVEGIYLEDDRDTIYGGSIIMAPPSYKSKGPNSVIYVNNQGIYSEPVVLGNGDTLATHLKHPVSTYSAPPTYLKKTESTYGGSRVLRVTDDLKGRHPNRASKKTLSEVNYGVSGRPRSLKGTLPRSRSQSDLGAL